MVELEVIIIGIRFMYPIEYTSKQMADKQDTSIYHKLQRAGSKVIIPFPDS